MKYDEKVFTPPFRVGKKTKRAVLDAKGLEVVFFQHSKTQAQLYCDFLNIDVAENVLEKFIKNDLDFKVAQNKLERDIINGRPSAIKTYRDRDKGVKIENVDPYYNVNNYKAQIFGDFKFPRENHSIEEIILMFENGRSRYDTDSVLNSCVNSIVRGGNPIKLLDQVIKMLSDSQEQLIKTVKEGGTRIFISKDYRF